MPTLELPIDSIILVWSVELIIQLTGSSIVGLTGGIVGFGANMLAEVCMIVAIAAVIGLEVALLRSCAPGNLWAGIMIDSFAGTVIVVVSDNSVDILVGMVVNMCAVTTIALDSIPMLVSSEWSFALGKEASSCLTSTPNCRALHASMPSYHV